MTYDTDKYKALRSLEVPHKIALALADDSNPLAAGGVLEPGAAVADLAGGATLPTTVTKVNELLASLRAAGLIDT